MKSLVGGALCGVAWWLFHNFDNLFDGSALFEDPQAVVFALILSVVSFVVGLFNVIWVRLTVVTVRARDRAPLQFALKTQPCAALERELTAYRIPVEERLRTS